MRRMMIFAVVVAVLVASLGSVALAKGQGKGQGRGKGGDKAATYVFKGVVVEASDGSLLLEVKKGNKKARPFVGEQVDFAVVDGTKVERDDVPMAVTELVPGEDVVVQSKAPRNATEFTARRVSAETLVGDPEPVEPTEPVVSEPVVE